MKNTSWLVLLLALGLAGFCGCSKSDKPPTTQQVNGVGVDLPKLSQAFASSSPEVLSDVSQVSFGLRYGDYMKSLAALDKLANNPAVTEPQKKVVNDVIEQVKKVMAQAPAPPAQ
jgi:hypothetical protein